MNFRNTEWSIEHMLTLMKEGELKLNPPYQRNFIWTKKDQSLLVDSIIQNFPMPNFFVRRLSDGTYEMVDGKQRATTIQKFNNSEIVDSKNNSIADYDSSIFLSYKLNVVEIEEDDDEQIHEFFYRVNKLGTRLNSSEINHAYYNDSDFKSIVNYIVDNQNFINLDLFSDRAIARMGDDSLVDEIVAYLHSGITDKRIEVDKLLKLSIPKDKQKEITSKFDAVLEVLVLLNQQRRFNSTRFRQRNDFYTLFCFINEHISECTEVLQKQYEFLVFINDCSFISPSNMDCPSFREYAIHCVMQSNSATARKARLQFLNELLCCKEEDSNDTIEDVATYFYDVYSKPVNYLVNGNYKIIDISGYSNEV